MTYVLTNNFNFEYKIHLEWLNYLQQKEKKRAHWIKKKLGLIN